MKALVYHGPGEKQWESKPTLLESVSEGRLDPTPFATHRFGLGEIMDAYDVFSDAAKTSELKVVLSAS